MKFELKHKSISKCHLQNATFRLKKKQESEEYSLAAAAEERVEWW